MSYIGSSAAVVPVAFSGVNSQAFNGDGSTVAFTLNRPVSNVKDIEVVVNNVQQSPYDSSYSVSNTTLTFSAAPSSGTANIYVTYLDFPVGSVTDPNAVPKTGGSMTGNLSTTGNIEAATYTQGGSPLEAGAKEGIFWENNQTVTADYTITSGKNAGSFGPIEIATGVTVTIPTGSEWSIV